MAMTNLEWIAINDIRAGKLQDHATNGCGDCRKSKARGVRKMNDFVDAWRDEKE